MPHSPTLPAGTRFFARLDRFECECPKCGQILHPMTGAAGLPHTLKAGGSKLRNVARHNPAWKNVRKLCWNPYTQRLHCPYCHHTYIAGLILWSLREGQWPPLDPPPDAVPEHRQMLQMRALHRGWWTLDRWKRKQEANYATACQCPPRGTSRTCSLHGWPELRQGQEQGQPQGQAPAAQPDESAGEVVGRVENETIGVKSQDLQEIEKVSN